MDEQELRKIISEVLQENPRVMYIPALAPYLLEKLDKVGYRRVGDNMVAIEKEEYERLKQEETYRLLYGRSWTAKRKDDYEEARKETAKEIFEKIHQKEGYYPLACVGTSQNDMIAIAKEYGIKYTPQGVEVEG